MNRPADRQGLQSSLLADKLFGPPAPFASESNEVRLGFTDLAHRAELPAPKATDDSFSEKEAQGFEAVLKGRILARHLSR
jgi:hypothetical protein